MMAMPQDGRARAVIENVTPRVDDGRYPVKRIVGDALVAEADVFADGHDEVRAHLGWRREGEAEWHEHEMEPLGNDRWRASFALDTVGRYEFRVSGWVDRWRTWVHDLQKRVDAGQDVTVDLQIGAQLARAATADAQLTLTTQQALDPAFSELVERKPSRAHETVSDSYFVVVDPERARFSAWYEMFPRSASPDPKRHGTFRDVIARLPYVQKLGFDVLYLPPIHPIGRQFRKGPNNTASTNAADPGVPWAIGSADGGHMSVHPDLGTLADFDALVAASTKRGIQVALDIAFQASPDHPWVTEHPSWFRARPDGTIQYAENPPKKYQDIYPFDFESSDWQALWQALNGVFRFWIGHGVTIFRVDNPHTKAFPFWEWCIADLKRDHPEALFLAEAFTRPKVMYRLAKIGFSQSYTYFTWRNSAPELADYLTELTSAPLTDFFRPNLWPSTPDILHEALQSGGRPAFEARLILAATLSSSYGIYGPAYELGEDTPRDPGTEEFLDSEKYQQRTWDLERADSLGPLIAAVNRARRGHPALQRNERLIFHPIDNDNLLAYTKASADGSDIILTVANLDFKSAQSGTLELQLADLGLPTDGPLEALDLIDGSTSRSDGAAFEIELDPAVAPARIFQLRRI